MSVLSFPVVTYFSPSSRRTMLRAVARVVSLVSTVRAAPPSGVSATARQEQPALGFRWHPRGRALGRGELLALVDACKRDPSPAGARDTALLGVLYAGGLRRAEAVALDLADFDPGSGVLVVRCGKGRKARTVPLKNGAAR